MQETTLNVYHLSRQGSQQGKLKYDMAPTAPAYSTSCRGISGITCNTLQCSAMALTPTYPSRSLPW